ncbi:hypothetical protein [Cellulomonas sp. S1-8]|uniref:hypothetical protein n=1 Tax=Cellulomonas sp. S1-8 TaxID=2904790 RepID=UPI0022431662|nr:hypothetical protein [Cellulomonas sp. S1-8]UZN03539.1 hypothetical protein OKX07_00920 [Cellulomonas sp. S1-8]
MSTLQMLSPSAATDAAWLAAADVAAIATDLDFRYRLVGGISITLLAHHYGVEDVVPARETADADMGVPRDVCADERLLIALEDRQYKREGGNRFVRQDGDRELVIDVLAPAPGRDLEANHEIGSLSVDLIPGLLQAFLLPAVEVKMVAHLTDGTELPMTVALSDPRGALILKAFAYAGRFTDRDALDVWRLLEVTYKAGLTAADWPDRPIALEAAHLLHRSFAAPPAMGATRATPRPAEQARMRLLVQTIVPKPVV